MRSVVKQVTPGRKLRSLYFRAVCQSVSLLVFVIIVHYTEGKFKAEALIILFETITSNIKVKFGGGISLINMDLMMVESDGK